MNFKLNKVFASLMGLSMCMPVVAEDIELYVNHNVETDEKPRVLLIFDTSGSMDWSVIDGSNQKCYTKHMIEIDDDDDGNTNNGQGNGKGLDGNEGNGKGNNDDDDDDDDDDFVIEYRPVSCFASKDTYTEYEQQCYIKQNGDYVAQCHDRRNDVGRAAVTDLVTLNSDINFGLMRFNGSSGGYVLAKVNTDREFLLDKIANLPATGSTPLAETLWEAYLYITGQAIDYGIGISDRDISAETSATSNIYKSPFAPIADAPLRCDNSVNIILMTDGDPTSDNGKNTAIAALYNSTFDTLIAPVVSNSYLVALAKAIHGTNDVKVDLYPETPDVHDLGRVFTIGFGTGMSANGKMLLDETAKHGGGQYLHANTSTQLSDALKNTISRIREVNDSFSSPTVASNNVDQTRSRDAIYFAMFYPEIGARWRGNLKKLKVADGKVVDSTGNSAIDSSGLISKDAKTFWLPSGEPADGNAVAQGGVNQYLSTLDTDSRKLYTENQGTIVRFNTSLVDDVLDLIGVEPQDLTSSDIKWAMGFDVDDADNDGSITDQRTDIFGDPLHSKPLAIDYGNDDIRLLIGTNAGFLHMFKDNDNTISESWAFIPSALYNIIKPLRNNQSDTKVYGMDGPISVYFNNKSLNSEGLNDGVIDASKGDDVWAFAGMRRGGKNYYSVDITNPGTPSQLWNKPIEGGKDTGDFQELAQTWSKPQIAYIKAFGDKPLLVFGAGYDTNKDQAVRSDDSVGRGIYIVEAETGKRVWALTPEINGFTGKHSIAADVSTLDSDYDGYIDRIYAADTGGNIWRIDMPGSDSSQFSHFKLAELGSGSATQDRRFFYKPLVARTMFSKVTITTQADKQQVTRLDTPYDAIVIGSGNRSKPTGTSEQDQLFMIRDENTVTKSFKSNAPAAIVLDDLMSVETDPFGNALSNVDDFVELEDVLANDYKGWRYPLANAEKSLAAATVVGGVAYFTSFTPVSETSTENQCSLSGGGGSMYAFHLHYGTKVYDQLKFSTGYDVPDTPQLYFGEGNSCTDGNGDGKCDDNPDVEVKKESQFYLIGPGIKGENADNLLKPVEINGPGLKVVDGEVQLIKNDQLGAFGFKTQQTYIYKREENDEVQN